MARTAVIQSEVGQRAAIAAFMLLLLAVVSGLAFAATLRPALSVDVAELRVTLPADWRLGELSQSANDRARVLFENERRPALRAEVRAQRLVDGDGVAYGLKAPGLLAFWFPALIGAPFPEDGDVGTLKVDGLEVAYWSGVVRSRRIEGGISPVSLVAVAVVTEPGGRFWSIVMVDDNYRHEDPQERRVEHQDRFMAALASLERSPASVGSEAEGGTR